MFPIWINDGTTEMPKEDIFYIIAKNGIFMKKKMQLIDSIAPVKNISILNEIKTSIQMDLPKIPKSIFCSVLTFFRSVYDEHSSEAAIILHYNPAKKKYKLECPKQEVSSAAAKYESELSYKDKGFERVGTIHSHCNFSAFHSGTDVADEATWDGIHITIGDIRSDYFSLAISLVANGARSVVNPEQYLDEVFMITEDAIESKYNTEKKVFEKKEVTKLLGYEVTAPQAFFGFPKTWMKLVEKTVYAYSQWGTGGTSTTYYEKYHARQKAEAKKDKKKKSRRHNRASVSNWNQYCKAVDDFDAISVENKKGNEKKETVITKPAPTGSKSNLVRPVPVNESPLYMETEDEADTAELLLIEDKKETEKKEDCPCDKCIHKHKKSDMLLQDVLGDLDDEVLEVLGFEVEGADKPSDYGFGPMTAEILSEMHEELGSHLFVEDPPEDIVMALAEYLSSYRIDFTKESIEKFIAVNSDSALEAITEMLIEANDEQPTFGNMTPKILDNMQKKVNQGVHMGLNHFQIQNQIVSYLNNTPVIFSEENVMQYIVLETNAEVPEHLSQEGFYDC